MICALLLGRKGSVGFPGKNLIQIFGKPMTWYPMNAVLSSGIVDKGFISTDDPDLMALASETGFEVI